MWLFAIAAAAEGLTGLALVATPGLVAKLLLGTELDPGGTAMGRFGGVALTCFALACWPVGDSPTVAARRAMLLFQPAMTLVLILTAFLTSLAGVLLWPAILYHAGASIVLARRS